MPWLALPFEERDLKSTLSDAFGCEPNQTVGQVGYYSRDMQSSCWAKW